MSLVGFWVGVKVTRYNFDLARHRAECIAARALRADLTRIDKSLGTSANAFGASFYGMTFEPPTIHRWSEPLITQLAGADAEVVTDCMDLERELHNFGLAVKRFHDIQELTRAAEDDAKKFKNSPLGDEAPMHLHQQWAVQRVNAESRVDDLREAARDAIRMMAEHHGPARTRIAILLKRLAAIADAPDPQFMTLPDEQLTVQDWRATPPSRTIGS